MKKSCIGSFKRLKYVSQKSTSGVESQTGSIYFTSILYIPSLIYLIIYVRTIDLEDPRTYFLI